MVKFFSVLALMLTASVASASSPAIIKDAGTNPAYFASTAGEPDTTTGPVLNDPKRFFNGSDSNGPGF